MLKERINIFQRIQIWIDYHSDTVGIISSILVFIFLYSFFNKDQRQLDFQKYTTEVDLVSIYYEKVYALPEFYSTKQKLDRIIFKLEYIHKDRIYKSKAIVYWEYLTPNLEKIVDGNKLDKLSIRCKKDTPKDVMVFIKKE